MVPINEWNDVYDENRNLTGKVHRRGTPWNKGEYGLVVCVWVYDGKGKLLLTRRAPEKSFAGTWENSGGAVKAGETSRQAVARELREETGGETDRLEILGEYYGSAGFCVEKLTLYFAHLTETGETDPDEDEFLNLERIPFSTLVEQVLSGEIKDAKTIAAALKAKILLGL